MNVWKDHACAIEMVQTELGDDCPFIEWPIVKPTQYKILPGSVEQNRPLREGGFSQMFDFQCVLPVRQFITQDIPDAACLSRKLTNTQFVYLVQKYKVVSVSILSGATLIRIAANSANQNA